MSEFAVQRMRGYLGSIRGLPYRFRYGNQRECDNHRRYNKLSCLADLLSWVFMKKILFSFSMFFIATAVSHAQQYLGDTALKARAQQKSPETIVVGGEGSAQIHKPAVASQSSPCPSASDL